ncbi:MAG: hypothetical protein EBZ69_03965 [Alphaproteobacteria bacterium]|nr:hypothetical protein [Alphaproteobacteria bacterium]
MNPQLWITLVCVVIAYTAITQYVWAVYKKRVRPHVFSWIIWVSITAIASAAQWVGGAGLGFWTTACAIPAQLAVIGLTFYHGTKVKITPRDWLIFVVAMSAIPLWVMMDDPLIAVIIAAAVNATAFGFTLAKIKADPSSEFALNYGLHAVRFFLSVGALEVINLTTAFYPIAIGFFNLITAIIIVRARPEPRHTPPPV